MIRFHHKKSDRNLWGLLAAAALFATLGVLSGCDLGGTSPANSATPAPYTDPVTAATVSPAIAEASAQSMNTTTTAKTFVQAAKFGWNLGNQLDAHNNGVSSETAWGNPTVTQALMDAVVAEGFGIVRIPVTWLGHIGDSTTGYKVDEAWLARVAEIAGYVHNAGMKAIINIHHDGADSAHWLNIVDSADDTTERARIDDMFRCVWTQIATYFRNHGDWLIFEAVNEIHDGGWGWGTNRTDGGLQYAILNQWNQTFVTAVRGTGGNNAYRYLTVAGYVTNPDLTINYLDIPSDTVSNRLIVTVHFYDPNDFAIEATVPEWGSTGTTVSTWGQESNITTVLGNLKSTFVNAGYPVYLGECGATYQSGYGDFRRYYVEYLTKAAYDRGIVPIFWDNGASGSGKEKFGLFDRSTKAVYGSSTNNARDVIDAMNRAVTSSYALADITKP